MAETVKKYFQTQIPLTQETYIAIKSFLIPSQILGLYPVTIFKEKEILYLKISPVHAIYSYVLGLILVMMTFYGIYDDYIQEKDQSFRFKSPTEGLVAIFDVSVIQIIAIYGIFVRIKHLPKFIQLSKCLQEVQKVLPLSLREVKRDQKLSMFLLFFLITSTLSFFLVNAYNQIKYVNPNINPALLFKRYNTSSYVCIISVVVQFQFWCICRSILRPLRRLNKILETHLQDNDDLKYSNKNSLGRSKIIQVGQGNLSGGNQGYVRELATAYIRLGDCVNIVNDCWGPTIITLLIGSLTNLIECPFMLLLELSKSEKNISILVITVTWTLYHIIRLVILIEPASSCSEEASQMRSLINKLLRNKVTKDKFKDELEIFSTILSHSKIEFNAAKLTILHRSMLSSLIGVIITYLVILIEHRND